MPLWMWDQLRSRFLRFLVVARSRNHWVEGRQRWWCRSSRCVCRSLWHCRSWGFEPSRCHGCSSTTGGCTWKHLALERLAVTTLRRLVCEEMKKKASAEHNDGERLMMSKRAHWRIGWKKITCWKFCFKYVVVILCYLLLGLYAYWADSNIAASVPLRSLN